MHKGHTNIVELINNWKRDQSQVIKNDVNNEILNKLEVLENQLTTTNTQKRWLRNIIKLFKESKEDTK